MNTLKSNFKKIKLLREAKYVVGMVIDIAIFSLCRLVQLLPFNSKIIGPPKGYINSVSKFIADYSNTTGIVQPYVDLGSGTISINLFEKVFGDSQNYTSHNKELYYHDFLATVKPGRVHWDTCCVIGPDDRILTEVSNWWGEQPIDHKIFRKFKLPKVYALKGSSFLLGGFNDLNYAQFITETLPKFKLLNDCGLNINSFDHIIMYNYQKAYQQEMIDHFGILPHKLVYTNSQTHIEADELTIAPIFWTQRPWVGAFLKKEFAPNHSFLSGKRIYISRCKANSRRVINEDQISKLLISFGFEIIVNENHSIAQQAEIFSNADIIVGSHGAGLANIVFCKPGTKVLELRIEAYTHYHLDFFAVLSRHEKLRHYVQLCKAVDDNAYTHKHNVNLHVDVDQLKETLSYVLEDKNIIDQVSAHV